MSRHDLTGREWAASQPLLPNRSRGVPRVDDCRVVNGIFFILRTGVPWRPAKGLWTLHDGLQPLQPLVQERSMGVHFQCLERRGAGGAPSRRPRTDGPPGMAQTLVDNR